MTHSEPRVGILYPGQMGVSVAASAKNSGAEVIWASAGRSPQTRQRAMDAGLLDAVSLASLCDTCSIILCVCPPQAAEAVAAQVLDCRFRGLYLDANAISPERAKRIGEKLRAAGIEFVDGGIIGGPAWEPGTTYLYLSGEQAGQVAQLFSAGPLETEVLGEELSLIHI